MKNKSWFFERQPFVRANSAGNFRCGRLRCCTCTFTGKTAIIPSTGWGVRPKGWLDCTVVGMVYVIACYRCHTMYNGETGRRPSDRFGKHLRSNWRVQSKLTVPRQWSAPWPNNSTLSDHHSTNDTRVSVIKKSKEVPAHAILHLSAGASNLCNY